MTHVVTTHVHDWYIEPANGRRHSPGICLDCGAERKFSNSQVGPVTATTLCGMRRGCLGGSGGGCGD